MSQAPAAAEKSTILSKETFLSLYLPNLAISMGQGIATPVIPALAQSFGVSFELATLVLILNGLGGLVFTFPIGYMMDRMGRRPVLLIGPFLTAITSILTAFAPTFELLLLCRFLNGGAQQMWQLSRLTMITDTGKDRERGRLITWMQEVMAFGGLFSPAIGGFVATFWGIQMPFLLYGVLCIVAILPSFKLVKETDPERQAGFVGVRESVPWREVVAACWSAQMMAFFASQFMANFTRGINMGGMLNLYAAYKYEVGPDFIGLLASANSFIRLPLGLMTGYVMDRWGRKKTVVPGFSLLTVAMMFMTSTALYELPLEFYVAAYLCVTFAQGITSGNMMVIGSDMAPTRGRAQWMSLWRFIAATGSQLSPVVFTIVGGLFGYVGAFGIVGFSSLSVALLVGLLMQETVGRNRDQGPIAPATVPEPTRPGG
ncbi:MAG: MFS transporter [Chloroflexi bacterium]|nr:MFS transporter [Chloroflexota bacterium]